MWKWLSDRWELCVDTVKNAFFWVSHSIVLPLRYDIELRGGDLIDPKKGGVTSSILFLANHSSHIDGTILGITLLRKGLPLTIWALDLTFKLPYLRWAARHKDTVRVVKVPNINETRSEKHSSKLHKLITRTADGLNHGENFLIFPAGRCKKTPVEKIDGKSAIPLIIHQCPHVNVILVRTTGLWGSRFSCATKPEARWATRSIKGWEMFWTSLKMIILNGIFFVPKRKIVVELFPAGPDFPRFGSRLETNRYLEKRYNEAWGPTGEPLSRVPNYFWKEHYTEHEYVVKEYQFNLDQVPKPFRNTIVKIVADKSDLDVKDVNFDSLLGRDLGLDSLDLAEILIELEKQCGIKPLVPDDLTSVGHLIAIAAKIPIVCEVKAVPFHEVKEHKPFFSRIAAWWRKRFKR